MRAIRFLPLVFLVGIDGFAMFAPYAVLILMLGYIAGRVRSQSQLIPLPVES